MFGFFIFGENKDKEKFVFVFCWCLRFSFLVHSVSTSKIIISGIPLQTRFEDIEPLLKPYGIVKQCEAVSSKDPQTQTVHITFENYEQAQRYIHTHTFFCLRKPKNTIKIVIL